MTSHSGSADCDVEEKLDSDEELEMWIHSFNLHHDSESQRSIICQFFFVFLGQLQSWDNGVFR